MDIVMKSALTMQKMVHEVLDFSNPGKHFETLVQPVRYLYSFALLIEVSLITSELWTGTCLSISSASKVKC